MIRINISEWQKERASAGSHNAGGGPPMGEGARSPGQGPPLAAADCHRHHKSAAYWFVLDSAKESRDSPTQMAVLRNARTANWQCEGRAIWNA